MVAENSLGASNPEDDASPVSKLTFWWLYPLMKDVAKKKECTLNDVPPVRICDRSDGSHSLFKSLTQSKRNLSRCLFQYLCPLIFPVLPFFIIVEVLPICQAFLAGTMAEYLSGSDLINSMEGLLSAVGLIMLSIVSAILRPFINHQVYRFGLKMRIPLTLMIYEKILELDTSTCKKVGSGQLYTMFSTDIETTCDHGLLLYGFRLMTLPLVLPVMCWLVYRDMGWLGLSGILFTLIISLMSMCLTPVCSKTRGKVAKRTSERINIMSSLIGSIEFLKLYCWEKPYTMLVKKARGSEMKMTALTLCLTAIVSVYHNIGKFIPQFVSVLLYITYGNNLEPKQFVRVIGYLQAGGFSLVSAGTFLALAGNIIKSVNRIQVLLQTENPKQERVAKSDCKSYINCEDVSAIWPNVEATRQHISQVSFTAKKSGVTMVIGATGSGKSTLLMTLIGSTNITEGKICISDSVSFAPQEPWIFSGTIRENVVFGEQLDTEWYDKVIDACCLRDDINLFPSGDSSLIGEKGLNLSGGQRARISLARAVYQNKDIILLDDPLSAVDSGVGAHIFEHCIKGILSNKTVILATHHVQFLQDANKILLLEQGCLTFSGSYEDFCIQKPTDLFASIHEYSTERDQYQKYIKRMISRSHSVMGEDSEHGNVSIEVYKEVFMAGKGIVTFIPVMVLCLASYASVKIWEWFVSERIARSADRSFYQNITANITEDNTADTYRIYWILWAAYIVLDILHKLLLVLFIIFATTKIHNRMFEYIVGAKLSFFNRPVGVILNRFSRDLGLLDHKLYFTLVKILLSFSWLVTAVVFSWFTIPWLLVFFIPVTISSVIATRFGVKSVREFKRTEAIARSPLFSLISNTLAGHATIKVARKENYYLQSLYKTQDIHTSAYNLFLCSGRLTSLLISFGAIAYLIVAIIAIFVFNAIGYNGTLAGVIILTIAQSVDYAQQLPMLLVDLDMLMTCAERVIDYGKLPQEAEISTETTQPPNNWPRHGCITYDNVSLLYEKAQSFALHKVSFRIKQGEKIGIIGRTGSGKTSIFKVLTRLHDFNGTVQIDGINIKTMDLIHLRRAISIIPQEPTLLPCSIRKNLDPFGNHSDLELWKVLCLVQLADFVKELPAQLETDFKPGNCGLSQGQKQLICLARALLRKCKILITDEATSNVDYRTDEQIQKTINEQFKDCTVLTIAHRINTLMKYDKIMIISNGRLVNIDTPTNLIAGLDHIESTHL